MIDLHTTGGWSPGMVGRHRINKNMYLVIKAKYIGVTKNSLAAEDNLIGYPIHLLNRDEETVLDSNHVLPGEALDLMLEHTKLGEVLFG